jgi:hypothetical protein
VKQAKTQATTIQGENMTVDFLSKAYDQSLYGYFEIGDGCPWCSALILVMDVLGVV